MTEDSNQEELKWVWPSGYMGKKSAKVEYYCNLIVDKTRGLTYMVALLYLTIIIDSFFLMNTNDYRIVKMGKSEIVRGQTIIVTDGGPIVKTAATIVVSNSENPVITIRHSFIFSSIEWFSFNGGEDKIMPAQTMFDFLWIPLIGFVLALISFLKSIRVFTGFVIRVLLLISVFSYFLIVMNVG